MHFLGNLNIRQPSHMNIFSCSQRNLWIPLFLHLFVLIKSFGAFGTSLWKLAQFCDNNLTFLTEGFLELLLDLNFKNGAHLQSNSLSFTGDQVGLRKIIERKAYMRIMLRELCCENYAAQKNGPRSRWKLCCVPSADLNLLCSAPWVKSGNRGSLKCLKVIAHFVLLFIKKCEYLF